jgi:GTP-binding protein
VLGTIGGDERQAILADIPGLIEGAADGAGLGHQFLAHIERCAMLVHLVEVAPAEGEPASGYEAVRAELGSYGAGLEALPELVVLSKCDLLPEAEVQPLVAEWSERLGDRVLGVLAVSSATGTGLDQLQRQILSVVAEAPARMAQAVADGGPHFSAEHRVYRPEDEGGYWIESEDEGAYRVHGRGVAMLIERHDLGNVEALDYLEQRLTEMGVVAALRGAGFEAGDEVRVGELSFELHPN